MYKKKAKKKLNKFTSIYFLNLIQKRKQLKTARKATMTKNLNSYFVLIQKEIIPLKQSESIGIPPLNDFLFCFSSGFFFVLFFLIDSKKRIKTIHFKRNSKRLIYCFDRKEQKKIQDLWLFSSSLFLTLPCQ